MSLFILSQGDVILIVLCVTVVILSHQHCTGPVTGTRDCLTARIAIKNLQRWPPKCQLSDAKGNWLNHNSTTSLANHLETVINSLALLQLLAGWHIEAFGLLAGQSILPQESLKEHNKKSSRRLQLHQMLIRLSIRRTCWNKSSSWRLQLATHRTQKISPPTSWCQKPQDALRSPVCFPWLVRGVLEA